MGVSGDKGPGLEGMEVLLSRVKNAGVGRLRETSLWRRWGVDRALLSYSLCISEASLLLPLGGKAGTASPWLYFDSSNWATWASRWCAMGCTGGRGRDCLRFM